MKTKTLILTTLAVLTVAILSSCATGPDSGTHYVLASNGKGHFVPAPAGR